MAGSVGLGAYGEYATYPAMSCPCTDVLYRKSRLQQAFALQRHGNQPFTSSRAAPESEALFTGCFDQRNEKEGLLVFVHTRLVSTEKSRLLILQLNIDSFSAALLGLPKLLNEGDIHAEYPADVDDENVSERGFQSTLPGESTRVSSALALFRLSRVMSRILDENYPAALSHELSHQKSAALNDDLDAWLGSLPAHLRLHFVQDKPSTNVVGSRSPLLVCCSALSCKPPLTRYDSHSAITMPAPSSIALRLHQVSARKLRLLSLYLHNQASTLSRSFSCSKNAE